MVKTLRIGEHISWNSEARRVRGKISRHLCPGLVRDKPQGGSATETIMNKDRRKLIDRAANLLREAVDKIEEAKTLVADAAEGERDYVDNVSESLKGFNPDDTTVN
jgi:uncharacterized Zn finger protein